jgi:hypothetical protein
MMASENLFKKSEEFWFLVEYVFALSGQEVTVEWVHIKTMSLKKTWQKNFLQKMVLQ